MNKRQVSPVPSTAAIMGHPLHPIFIVFPIAFFMGAFATDLAFWRTRQTFWARVSQWLVGSGVVTGIIAAVLGLIDFLTIRRVREHTGGWIHFLGNVTAVGINAGSLITRIEDPVAAVLPWGLTITAITSGILGVTGWIGGEMVYRHMIGVTGHTDE